MLGRKTFTPEEIERGRSTIAAMLERHRAVAAAVPPSAASDLAALDTALATTLLLALDRPYVHRVRAVAGKDGNALNEVELLCDALLLHGGVLQPSTVIKLVPEQSVTGIAFGAPVVLDLETFARLADAFFAALVARFG